MKTASIRILPGLPIYGAPAEPFPASGYGAHREGVVVEFVDNNGNVWVGNFQPGLGSYTAVFDTFGKDRPVIIAGGGGYVVDVPSRKAVEEFGGAIEWCLELREGAWLVLADRTNFEARNREGVVWRSDRVSWDGMRDLTHCDGKVHGYAYSPLDDNYKSFDLDLSTGRFRGGSYNGP